MFTVWVGGAEVTEYLLGAGEALSIQQHYMNLGYEDILIEEITGAN